MGLLKITDTHKKLLKKASRSRVEDYFVALPRTFRSKKWLLKTNRYRESCISLYNRDTKPLARSLNHDDLYAYVSASAPTQIIDGWSYLGRAIDATLRGDPYAATHLGYYAELRAAMGLLACEGVGVLSKNHTVIDHLKQTHTFKGKGTHSDIWPMLNYWSMLAKAANLLDDLVKPNSIRLSDWLAATGTSTVPVKAVAMRWLQSWGLDLANVDDDHDSRNLVSYRPSEFRRPKQLNVHQQTSFVEELWQLFEPGTVRRFPNIERFLLRNAHRKQSRGILSPAGLQRLGLTAHESLNWITFLQKTDDPKPFQLIEERVPIEDPTCHLRIISRAALLLFIASAAARRLLLNAGYSLNDILFWWGQHGEERALWDAGSLPSDPRDMWADIAQAISDSASWRISNPIATASLHQWRHNQGGALADFGGFELVGIWALMP